MHAVQSAAVVKATTYASNSTCVRLRTLPGHQGTEYVPVVALQDMRQKAAPTHTDMRTCSYMAKIRHTHKGKRADASIR